MSIIRTLSSFHQCAIIRRRLAAFALEICKNRGLGGAVFPLLCSGGLWGWILAEKGGVEKIR